LDVAIFREVDDNFVVGKDAGLGEAVHVFVNFAIDKTIDGDGFESVVLDDGGGDVLHSYAHVLWSVHGRVQIKVLYVKRHAFGVGCGDDTFEEQFFCRKDAVESPGESGMKFWARGARSVERVGKKSAA
jgi:hypothetical protein